MILPRIAPVLVEVGDRADLTRADQIFEPRSDGTRAIGYIEGEKLRLAVALRLHPRRLLRKESGACRMQRRRGAPSEPITHPSCTWACAVMEPHAEQRLLAALGLGAQPPPDRAVAA